MFLTANASLFIWRTKNSFYNLFYHTSACRPLLNIKIIVTAIKPAALNSHCCINNKRTLNVMLLTVSTRQQLNAV